MRSLTFALVSRLVEDCLGRLNLSISGYTMKCIFLNQRKEVSLTDVNPDFCVSYQRKEIIVSGVEHCSLLNALQGKSSYFCLTLHT